MNEKLKVKIEVTGIKDRDVLEIRMVNERLKNLITEFRRNGVEVDYHSDDLLEMLA